MRKKLNKKDREVLRYARLCGADVDGDIVTYYTRHYKRTYYVFLLKNYIKPLTKRISIAKKKVKI